jgi:RNA polymerase sigma-70 factor (ECF subfamily)
VHVKRESYEPGRPFRPWLYAIATNQAIDMLRRRRRHAAVSLDNQPNDAADGTSGQLLELLEHRGPSPLDAVSLDERRRRVRDAVERLPDFLKQVVLLAYFQGLPYRDVAEALNIPVGTVKSRLNSALHRLHEAWGENPATPASE